MKRVYIVIITFSITVLISGCSLFNSIAALWGNKTKTGDPLPPISDFSATEYEQSKYCFPEIKSATWHHDGTSEEIDVNDPRLYQLLNALVFSYDEDYTAWRQGYVEETEFYENVNSGCPMIEICFEKNANYNADSEFANTPRVIISANRYYMLVDTSGSSWMADDGIYANEHFPFAKLLCDYYSPLSQEEEREIFGDIEWGNDKWINLLEYAGFVTQ